MQRKNAAPKSRESVLAMALYSTINLCFFQYLLAFLLEGIPITACVRYVSNSLIAMTEERRCMKI